MYCVFCGKPEVVACQSCGHWICPRHQHRWLSRTVCIGCRRKLIRILATQIALSCVAAGVIVVTAWCIFSQ
jgi:hypothetical protein